MNRRSKRGMSTPLVILMICLLALNAVLIVKASGLLSSESDKTTPTPPVAGSTIDITPDQPEEISFLGAGMDADGNSLTPGQPAEVELGAGRVDIYCLDRYQLMPLSGSGLTWSSDNEEIATVDSNGLVETKAAGTAVITATDPAGNSDSCTVNVIKVIYLTIDDKPNKYTLDILDVLDEYGVKGTFFLNASSKVADLYPEIHKRGHRLALHGYAHLTSYKSSAAFIDNMEKCRDFLVETVGCSANDIESIMRFPTGSRGQKNYRSIVQNVQRKGYTVFDWTTEFHDASLYTKAEVLSYYKKFLNQDRAIFLFHSKKHSLAALPEAIEYALNKGYTFAPLTEYTTQYNFRGLYVEEQA